MKTETTIRKTTRAEVLRYLKDYVFNVKGFDNLGYGCNSYIYVTCNDEPEHFIVIQRETEQDILEEFKALKVGDIAEIQEYYGYTWDTCTIEITHTFSNKGCTSVIVERYHETAA